jgi:hypothetical protein
MTISQSFCIEQKIERIIEECIQSISHGMDPFLPAGSFPTCLNRAKKANHRNLYRLAIFLRILDLVHEAQSSPNPITQRDIFYKDVVLFRTQATSENAIENLAKLLKLTREEMNIVTSYFMLIIGGRWKGFAVWGSHTQLPRWNIMDSYADYGSNPSNKFTSSRLNCL